MLRSTLRSTRCSSVRPSARSALLVVLGACIAWLGALPAAGQIPETFTNLQILDPETERGELIGIMRSWAGDLGVRCHYCHVGPDNLQGMDFASDEKATKRTARQMLTMSRTVNRELLADLPSVAEGEERLNVGCFTCHRGLPRPPRPLIDELQEADGPDAAVERFQTLRAAHEGAGQYDFRPVTLDRLSRYYQRTRKPEDARRIVDAALEIFPASASTWLQLYDVAQRGGDDETAEKAFARANELDPDDPGVAWVRAQREKAAAEAAAEAASDADGAEETPAGDG